MSAARPGAAELDIRRIAAGPLGHAGTTREELVHDLLRPELASSCRRACRFAAAAGRESHLLGRRLSSQNRLRPSRVRLDAPFFDQRAHEIRVQAPAMGRVAPIFLTQPGPTVAPGATRGSRCRRGASGRAALASPSLPSFDRLLAEVRDRRSSFSFFHDEGLRLVSMPSA